MAYSRNGYFVTLCNKIRALVPSLHVSAQLLGMKKAAMGGLASFVIAADQR